MSRKAHRFLFLFNIAQRVSMVIWPIMFGLDTLYRNPRMITAFVCFGAVIIMCGFDFAAHRLFKCASCGCNSAVYARRVLDYQTWFSKDPKLLICPKCEAKWDFGNETNCGNNDD